MLDSIAAILILGAVILIPLWIYVVARMISAACFKSWWESIRNRNKEEPDNGKEN